MPDDEWPEYGLAPASYNVAADAIIEAAAKCEPIWPAP